jgi:hypothetical protein
VRPLRAWELRLGIAYRVDRAIRALEETPCDNFICDCCQQEARMLREVGRRVIDKRVVEKLRDATFFTLLKA